MPWRDTTSPLAEWAKSDTIRQSFGYHASHMVDEDDRQGLLGFNQTNEMPGHSSSGTQVVGEIGRGAWNRLHTDCLPR